MENLFGTTMETNTNRNGLDPKKKKLLLIALGVLIVLVLIIIVMIMSISNAQNEKQNLIIDGKVIGKLNDSVVVFDQSGTVYIALEKIAPLVGYQYFNGEYQKGNEDKSQCYVKNADELTSMALDSYEIYKLSLSSTDSLYNKYVLDQPVKRFGEKLYISTEGFKRAFNATCTVDTEKQNIKINTLSYLYSYYQSSVTNKWGYKEMSKTYANMKSILNNMIVVKTSSNEMGVISTQGDTIIGTKYNNIEYSENSQEFIVTSNNKLGVLTSNGESKINLIYDELKVIDTDLGLYLVANSKKYGILDRNGNVMIYPEYDSIGIKNPSIFPADNIKNPYILYDNCIPVYKNNKVGLFDINGIEILGLRYSSFGYVSSTTKNQSNTNVLLIPASAGIEGIIVCRDGITYGIVNSQGKLVSSDRFNKIYVETTNGVNEYYMLFDGKINKVSDYFDNSSSSINGGGSVQINGTREENTPVDNTNNVLVNNNQTPTTNTIIPPNTTNSNGQVLDNNTTNPIVVPQ